MKTLSIRQPWASLICNGMKDVENRTWKPSELPCRILIHASSTRVPNSWANKTSPFLMGKLMNAIDFGWIDSLENLPTSAIIGYVDVIGVTTESDSLWAEEGCQQWLLENPHLFDEPIRDIKGKLNLFEFDLNEDQIPPAHLMKRTLPKIEGETCVITYTDKALEQQWEDFQAFNKGDDMLFYESDEMDTLKMEDGSLFPFTSIKIQNESRTRTIQFKVTESGYWIENEGAEDETISLCFRLGERIP